MNQNYQNYNSKADYIEMGQYPNDFESPKHISEIQIQIRLGFIRKVFGILASQLFFTVLFCIFSMTFKSFLEFQIRNIAIFIICLVASIVIPIIMVCFESAARQVPKNYIMLGVFTFCESYLVSFICGIANPRIVFMAAAMTFFMVISLTLYAFYTKTDFSMQGSALFIFGCGFAMLCLFGMFTQNKIFHIILACLGIILFGFYLVYDIQLIVGNKTFLLETDDYILSSLMLYTDIVGLFLNILELLQQLMGNNN